MRLAIYKFVHRSGHLSRIYPSKASEIAPMTGRLTKNRARTAGQFFHIDLHIAVVFPKRCKSHIGMGGAPNGNRWNTRQSGQVHIRAVHGDHHLQITYSFEVIFQSRAAVRDHLNTIQALSDPVQCFLLVGSTKEPDLSSLVHPFPDQFFAARFRPGFLWRRSQRSKSDGATPRSF